jgi:mannosyltransferase OCH1-like enzyme
MIIIFILLFIIILFLLCYQIQEPFFEFEFENIPKYYGNNIDNIYQSNTSEIPKIIHHICPKDFTRWNIKWFSCYESWLRIFPEPEYKHMHWFDDELHKVIQDEEFIWFLDVFTSYSENIKRIDMVRPFILWKYGGIYADMDYMVFKNFYNELDQNKVSLCESPFKGNEDVTNALMASPKGNNFWLLVIDECYKHKDTYVLLSTGPQLITKIYHLYPELVSILPENKYNPFDNVLTNDDMMGRHHNTVAWL